MYEGRPLARPDEPIFDQGLAFDLETELSRRKVLKLLGLGAGILTLAACGPAASSPSPSAAASAAATAGPTSAAAATATATATAAATASATAGAGATADCDVIPEETAGPFPGDGSNGPNVLVESGVVRKDITQSFGEFSGTAPGVPLTIRMIVQDAGNNCAPIDGAAVYVWHCTADGAYSLYSDGVTEENFLRGVQEADANGVVEFTSVYPGCYPGRWPHIHFEVYPSLETASDESNRIATSQIALPEDASAAVYAVAGYESSVQPFQNVSLARDNVFRDDGGVNQLGTASGDAMGGFVVELTVPVRA
jgi:protocatechuate 3,4-dioxygenase beta subunit